MASDGKSWRDCQCRNCFLIRITYALRVAVNCKDITESDMARALVIITHHNWIADIEDGVIQ